jgi:hypothetical protein
MGRTKIKTFIFGLLMTLGGLPACNRVGDQYCDVGSDPADSLDQCPYGTANNVHVDPEPCAPIARQNVGCDDLVSWKSTIWPLLIKPEKPSDEMPDDDRGGGCANTGSCHNTGQSRGVKLTADADAAWVVLSNYLGGRPTHYLDDGEDSWILCNLQSRNPGGGVTMPPTKEGLDPTTFDRVRKWAECGQRQYTDAEAMMMTPGGGD